MPYVRSRNITKDCNTPIGYTMFIIYLHAQTHITYTHIHTYTHAYIHITYTCNVFNKQMQAGTTERQRQEYNTVYNTTTTTAVGCCLNSNDYVMCCVIS